jgi:catechol 2,3-dioxygenase-like lactoylglutathione lyase family enzyme
MAMQASNSTAVDFPTKMRAHIALASADVEGSIAFYRQLLGQEPSKVREGYAKFEVAEPPLNLTLNYAPAPTRQISPAHFGVQVKSTGEVMTKLAAMNHAGFPARTEEGVGCCFSIQDKAWFVDPDGNQWEVFVVTEADIPEHSRPTSAVDNPAEPELAADQPARDCCAPSCCA